MTSESWRMQRSSARCKLFILLLEITRSNARSENAWYNLFTYSFEEEEEEEKKKKKKKKKKRKWGRNEMHDESHGLL